VRARSPLPASATDDVGWRRALEEGLDLRRISVHEYAMFRRLDMKGDPDTGIVRTSGLILAEKTGLTAKHVEQLCRALRSKGYVGYPAHRRRTLAELAISPSPPVDDTDRDGGRA
jgi:hypothetical protein